METGGRANPTDSCIHCGSHVGYGAVSESKMQIRNSHQVPGWHCTWGYQTFR